MQECILNYQHNYKKGGKYRTLNKAIFCLDNSVQLMVFFRLGNSCMHIFWINRNIPQYVSIKNGHSKQFNGI